MRETLEREIKLVAGEGFTFPELAGERLPERTFISTYHDTPDLRLARSGVTLRHRVEGGTGLWQLKLPRGSARLELELPGQASIPPDELVELLPAHLRGNELEPVARLRTRRETIRARGAEIVDDSVSVLEGQHVTRRFREIEIELVDGSEQDMRWLVREMRRHGAIEQRPLRPKLHQALDIAAPHATLAIERDSPSGVALGIALGQEVKALLAHDPGTRRGADPEDLHQLRVAVRRLRAFLRVGGILVETDWAVSLREELGWLGGHLGPARDLDVMRDRLRREVSALEEEEALAEGLLVALEEERTAAYRDVVEVLGGARYFALLERLETVSPPPLTGDQTTLAALFHRAAKRMRRTFSALGYEPTDAALHASRIAVKRTRYAADLAAHELGRPGERFVGIAKQLQDVLGDHQDAVFAEARIRAWAASDRSGSFVAGRLVQLERDRKAAARAAWPEIWQRLDAAARRAVR